MEAREVRRQKRDASSRRTPNGVRDDRDENIGGCNGAEELRDPVEKSLQGAEASGDPKADGDCGIQMTAGNVGNSAHHNCIGETVGDGDTENADGRLSGGAEILIGANRADAEENQRKCAEELREKLLRQAIQRIPPSALGSNRICRAARDFTEFAGRKRVDR